MSKPTVRGPYATFEWAGVLITDPDLDETGRFPVSRTYYDEQHRTERIDEWPGPQETQLTHPVDFEPGMLAQGGAEVLAVSFPNPRTTCVTWRTAKGNTAVAYYANRGVAFSMLVWK
jgi:hypothetical protein